MSLYQKYEKPKFVQCLAFLNNGDILTGDSGGIMLIWTRSTAEPAPGKGPKGTRTSHTCTHTHTYISTASILKHLHIIICPSSPAFPHKKFSGASEGILLHSETKDKFMLSAKKSKSAHHKRKGRKENEARCI